MARYIYEWKQTEHGRRLFRRPRAAQPARTASVAEPQTETAGAPTYSSLKKDALVAEADGRGIDSTGTKADIIERLEQADGD